MGVIFWLSTDAGSYEATASWTLPFLQGLLPWATREQLEFLHFLQRKLGHVFEYALLAFLWRRALIPDPASARLLREWGVFGITVGYAVFDELHQGWTGSRGAGVGDVVLDAGAALAMLLLLRYGGRPALSFLTGLLLWVAALGGTLLLLLNLSVSVRGGWLWISAPLAWIGLWLWRRRNRYPSLSS
jgi:VanZ family protein